MTPSPSPAALASATNRPTTDERAWPVAAGFGLVVAVQALLLAASNFPTPLFPIYARRYGFGSGTVTLLFAAYAFAVIPSLLTLGRLSDRVGRRPVLVTGVAITALSSVAFASARGLPWLFAGEVIYGIASGLVMSTVPVAIRELHPRGSVTGGAQAVTLAAATGLTLGPLLSAALAEWTPWPTVSPYALDIVLALGFAAALARIPETRPVVARRERTPVLIVPNEIRAAFLPAALASATAWMAIGWVFGLSPSFLHEELGVDLARPIVSGLFAALIVGSNGVTQLLVRGHDTARALHLAVTSTGLGVALVVASTLGGGLGLAIVGGLLVGAGTGTTQMHTMATVQRIAPDHLRGGVMAAFLTCCYAAMSVPVVIAGPLADHLGLGLVSGGYALGLGLLVAASLVASVRHRRTLTPTDLDVDDDQGQPEPLAIYGLEPIDLSLEVA